MRKNTPWKSGEINQVSDGGGGGEGGRETKKKKKEGRRIQLYRRLCSIFFLHFVSSFLCAFFVENSRSPTPPASRSVSNQGTESHSLPPPTQVV